MTKRTDHYRRALDDAEYIVDKLGPAEQRMMDARPGLPGAQAFDSPSVSGGGNGGPVEAALNLTGGTEETDDNWKHPVDQARTDIAAMDTAIREMTKHAAILRRLIDTYTPHAASSKDKARVERANDPTDCEHHTAAGIFEPCTTTGKAGGNLPHPMRLCDFCYREVYRKGRLPRGEVLVERHHKGTDPMVKVEA